MFFDKQNLFAWNTTIPTATSAGVVVGDVLDLWGGQTIPPPGTGSNAAPYAVNGKVGGTFPHDLGRGQQLQIYATITTALNSGGTAVWTLQLVNGDNADLVTGNSIVLATIVPATTITNNTVIPAGTIFKTVFALPPGGQYQFLGLREVVATAVLTGGKISAGLVVDRQTAVV